jgi:hypothetical protein
MSDGFPDVILSQNFYPSIIPKIFNVIFPENESIKRSGCCGITKSLGGGKYANFELRLM